jgi:hypothetical protein
MQKGDLTALSRCHAATMQTNTLEYETEKTTFCHNSQPVMVEQL